LNNNNKTLINRSFHSSSCRFADNDEARDIDSNTVSSRHDNSLKMLEGTDIQFDNETREHFNDRGRHTVKINETVRDFHESKVLTYNDVEDISKKKKRNEGYYL